MALTPGKIHMQKAIAMGLDGGGSTGAVDYDGDGHNSFGTEKAFGKGRKIHGGEEVSRKKHLKDGDRSTAHLEKHADHGPHEMNCPKDGARTGSEPKNIA